MILQLGNPVLRKVAGVVPLTSFTTKQVKEVVHSLYRSIENVPAWGVSAPQIGYSEQVFLMATPSIRRSKKQLPTVSSKRLYPEGLGFGVHYTAIFNPKILRASSDMDTEYETCLSIPGIAAIVPRHVWIETEFSTLDGRRHQHILKGHPARVFQHEYDHLHGLVIFDRVLDTVDIIMESEIDNQVNASVVYARRQDATPSTAIDSSKVNNTEFQGLHLSPDLKDNENLITYDIDQSASYSESLDYFRSQYL